MEREVVTTIIKHIKNQNASVPIVVGGSDAFARPDVYIEAGATVVVLDKSGGSNHAAIEYALSQKTNHPCDLYTKEGGVRQGSPRMSPNDWPTPPLSFVKETVGHHHWRESFPKEFMPMTSIMFDHGCDRKCNFCLTPQYKLGYQYMSSERFREWLTLQKLAGARSVNCSSDQFLGRILYEGKNPDGRKEIDGIIQAFKDLELNWMWRNGLELTKATYGRGLPKNKNNPNTSDPDPELVRLLWGWKKGSAGCVQAYIPAERPVDEIRERYPKLLSWQHHVKMMKAIVTAGVPDITYGLIIGLPEDSHESFARLFDAVWELREELYSINPQLRFSVTPNAIMTFDGTPLTAELIKRGLREKSVDSALINKWTPIVNTEHISSKEVAVWQGVFYRNFRVGKGRRGVTAFDDEIVSAEESLLPQEFRRYERQHVSRVI